MSPQRKLILSAIACGVAGAGLAVVPASVESGSAGGETSPETLRPITYFNDKCANCHGDYGNFWGEGFAADFEDEALREIVEEMAEGPAQAPLDEGALDVQTAYHRSLVDGKPFLVAWREDDGWRGEVTPKSKIELADGSGEATVEGHQWSLDADADELVVMLDDARTRLALDEKSQRHGVWYSHRKRATTQPAGEK